MTFKEFIAAVDERAVRMFNKSGRFLPMFHMISNEGEVVVPAPAGDKDTAFKLVRMAFEVLGVKRYAHITEAWIASAKNEEEGDKAIKHAKSKSLESFPGRMEALLIMAEDDNEGTIGAWREIIRTGNVTILGDLKFMEGGEIGGRMVGLLPRNGRMNS